MDKIEKRLDFLGYHNYKVDIYGNIYTLKYKHPSITEEKIIEIRNLYKENISIKELTKRFNLSRQTINRIINLNIIWIPIKPRISNKKSIVTLYLNTKNKNYQVGHLILLAFVGSCPTGLECCHNDGNHKNNKLENLRWDTHQNNINDKIKHGTNTYGEKSYSSKLKNKDVIDIRNKAKNGQAQSEIVKQYPLSQSAISNIINRKTWKHI